jgi:hypothetical protein
LVWLSLTTYAWEDYDSICGAFYYGLYWLEDAMGLQEGIEFVNGYAPTLPQKVADYYENVVTKQC